MTDPSNSAPAPAPQAAEGAEGGVVLPEARASRARRLVQMITGENALRGAELECTDRANALHLAEAARGSVLWVPSLGWHAWTGTHWAEDETTVVRLACQISGHLMGEAAWVMNQAAALKAQDREEDAKSAMLRAARLVEWAHKAPRIAAMQRLAQSFLVVRAAQLDADPWLLNVANGTLDLRSGELRPHNPADLITRMAPVAYDPAASWAPQWESFLQRVLPSLDLLQRAAG